MVMAKKGKNMQMGGMMDEKKIKPNANPSDMMMSSGMNMGMMYGGQAKLDKNKDGKITKAEATGPFARMFSRVDANSDGVIDEAELKRMSSRFGGCRSASSGGVDEGKPAPDFQLKTVDGKKEVKLSSFAGKKPVALIFGSYT